MNHKKNDSPEAHPTARLFLKPAASLKNGCSHSVAGRFTCQPFNKTRQIARIQLFKMAFFEAPPNHKALLPATPRGFFILLLRIIILKNSFKTIPLLLAAPQRRCKWRWASQCDYYSTWQQVDRGSGVPTMHLRPNAICTLL